MNSGVPVDTVLAIMPDAVSNGCAGYAFQKQISLSDLLLHMPMLPEWVARSFIAKGDSIGMLWDPTPPASIADLL